MKKEQTRLIVRKNVFFKLMINSVYGKIMGNLRKRINVRLVNNEKNVLKQKSLIKNYAAIH